LMLSSSSFLNFLLCAVFFARPHIRSVTGSDLGSVVSGATQSSAVFMMDFVVHRLCEVLFFMEEKHIICFLFIFKLDTVCFQVIAR
jgi:hypothetical protein